MGLREAVTWYPGKGSKEDPIGEVLGFSGSDLGMVTAILATILTAGAAAPAAAGSAAASTAAAATGTAAATGAVAAGSVPAAGTAAATAAAAKTEAAAAAAAAGTAAAAETAATPGFWKKTASWLGKQDVVGALGALGGNRRQVVAPQAKSQQFAYPMGSSAAALRRALQEEEMKRRQAGPLAGAFRQRNPFVQY